MRHMIVWLVYDRYKWFAGHGLVRAWVARGCECQGGGFNMFQPWSNGKIVRESWEDSGNLMGKIIFNVINMLLTAIQWSGEKSLWCSNSPYEVLIRWLHEG